jgi:pimeloyl-ACP methyl ester carboxylesterase
VGHRHRLIAIDLPGHGASARAADPASNYTLPGYADVLLELSERLGAEQSVFVGWSLGGHVILEAAPRLLAASGLLIIGAPPVSCPPARVR